MRVMDGRLGNLVRSPLVRHSYLNNGEPKRPKRRRESSAEGLPRPVQFDESSDHYRCFCGIFHVKTGAYLISVIELFLILVFFLNSLLVLLQQREDLDPSQHSAWGGIRFVRIAFVVESVLLTLAFCSVLLLLLGLAQNSASLLVAHLIMQSFSLPCLLFLLVAGLIAICTDLTLFYRLLNAVPFQEFPGQSTISPSADFSARIYIFLALYLLTLLLELWFLRIIYNCNRYLSERRKYMLYCLAYSTPLKTLSSAR